ncbi:MAG: single-stranded DNA-binding protein [Planctomycetota bacterium]
MANLNKVMLIGRLTRDPELRYTQSGQAMAKLGIAVNRYYNDRDGNRQEQTSFIDVTYWGKSAETINQYMSKGKELYVEGRLQLDQWETPEGEKRSKLQVVGETFQFIGGRGDSGGSPGPRQSAASFGSEGAPQYGGGPAAPQSSAPDDDLNLDDIPF